MRRARGVTAATKWPTLTDFVQMLGREGYCKVEDTPKGWFIQLVVNNPFENIKEEKRLKRDRDEGTEDARNEKQLLSQVHTAPTFRARRARQL